MTDTTPRAGAPLLAASQAQKHVTHNEALYQFDAFLCARFLDRDLSTPPSSPADGDTYLVKATGSGAWMGQSDKIAFCADGAWRFYEPFAGLVAFVSDESILIVYNGSSWVDYASLIALQNIPMLGVNATADATNKLSVQSNAALFTDLPTGAGGSGDMRVTLNKQAVGNTASFVLQDGFSGRAEVGLAGDDNFHFKVSPDGSTWTEAVNIAASTGLVALPEVDINGGTIDGASIGSTTPASGKFTTLQANASIAAPAITSGTAGNLTLATSGGTQLTIVHTASTVNALQVTGSASGVGTATLTAAGADTNIDIVLTAKGTGAVRLHAVGNGSVATTLSSVGPTGAHTTVQEWFAVKNASGTLRYVPAF